MRPEEKENVVVVGASVAGLFTAYQLAKAGVRVRVYDAEPELSSETRTLIVTPAWLRLFDFDVDDAILNYTDTFELISYGASARIPLHKPDVILERVRFIDLLASKVREAGGELILGHRFERMKSGDSLRLCLRKGHGPEEVTASTVIGADGVHSTVAQEVGRDNLERVAISQARVPLPADLSSDTVRVWFNRGQTRFFYWLIPESDRIGAAGLIADTEAQADQALEWLLADQDLEPIEYQSALVPMGPPRFRPSVTVGNSRVLLVGDAAGQVKVTTVGGVVTGMRGAEAAVRSILHGTSYATERRSLRRELSAHALVRHVLDGFTDQGYNQLLTLLNRKVVRILSRHNRDELTNALWRLLPAQPRWLFLGARALLHRPYLMSR